MQHLTQSTNLTAIGLKPSAPGMDSLAGPVGSTATAPAVDTTGRKARMMGRGSQDIVFRASGTAGHQPQQRERTIALRHAAATRQLVG